MPLSATRVKALKDPGRFSDGGGLHLFISKAGRKSWVQRITIDGHGGISAWAASRRLAWLKPARRRRTIERPLRAVGTPSRTSAGLRCRPSGMLPLPSMRLIDRAGANGRHSASWMQTLERHAMPSLGSTPLDRIDRADVLRVLTPVWTTRPETARRVRQRMRTIFRWAMAHGFMETNPAGEAIDGALPPYAEGEGPSQSAALSGGRRGAQDCGCVPSLHSSQAVFPVSGLYGGAFR